jgi:hypothetical protein
VDGVREWHRACLGLCQPVNRNAVMRVLRMIVTARGAVLVCSLVEGGVADRVEFVLDRIPAKREPGFNRQLRPKLR